MARAYSGDLRVRVSEAINGGLSTRQAAARFAIGVATAGAWHRCWRKSGETQPGRVGNPGCSKLDPYEDFILGLIATQKDIALHEIAERLAQVQGLTVQPSTVWYFLDKRGVTFKKRQRMQPSKSAPMSRLPGERGSKTSRALIPHG
jgi:transposase